MGPPPCAAVRPWDAATGRHACSGPRREERFSIVSPSDRATLQNRHPPPCRCETRKGEYTLHSLSRLPRKCTGANVLFHTFPAQANTPDTQVVQDQASVRHFQSRHFKCCRQTGSRRILTGRLRTPVLPGNLSTQGYDTVGDCHPTVTQRHWEHPARHGEEEPPNNIKGPHVSDVSALTNALMVIGPRDSTWLQGHMG